MPNTLSKKCGRCGSLTRIPKPNWKEMFQKTPHYRNARRRGRLHLWCRCDLKPFMPMDDLLKIKSPSPPELPESIREDVRRDIAEILGKHDSTKR